MNIDIRDNNRKSDILEYRKSVDVLGVEKSPMSLAEFQDLKYNDVERYERILDKVFVQQKINSSEWGKTINPDKQLHHMELTYKDGKSYIYDYVDVQKLFDDYYGTGRLKHDRYGRPTNKEIVQLGYSIGVNASDNSEATAIKIHHSKNRTHIVPKKGE
ncbi:polymorphic toxin type 50 domain-containing protein [Ligilactobacillus ruminis]|uniref:polymorphic toxin type 50 domain-containing protein n=1 Tax=Ligilactobacillus ruminis TaxID=1623 RepID=UPI0022E00414|nr:polymorphic toxin type 50 domain-containing protein [Ligilactobacillus ruminis]